MLDRKHIENLLRINGASPVDDESVVRSVLLNARYSKDEVDTALMVLREDPVTKETRVDGLHKVFRTASKLTPAEISTYLGVQTEIQNMPTYAHEGDVTEKMQMTIIWIVSITVAVVLVLLYMYIYQVGFFHPALGLAYFNG